MGTIISDSSHFTAFNRSILQCQATVIVSGFIPWCSDLRLLIRKICPDPCFPACYNRTFRMSARLFFRNCFLLNCLPGRSTIQTFVGLALLLSFECKTFRACTLLDFRKVFGSRSSFIIIPPFGSTFQRTPFGGWCLSDPSGVTLRSPASALSISRFPCSIGSVAHLSSASLFLIFRADFYRSPDESKLSNISICVKLLTAL